MRLSILVNSDQLQTLALYRPRFLSFVRSRLQDRAAAEDVLQSAYARAVENADATDPRRLVPWFYRILRNAVTDQYRRAAAEARGRDRLEREPPPRPTVSGNPCRCVRTALAGLKPSYREILEAVDVGGQPAARFAEARGMSSGNAFVRLHRARRLLADALKGICGTCTLDGCADCDCHSSLPASL